MFTFLMCLFIVSSNPVTTVTEKHKSANQVRKTIYHNSKALKQANKIKHQKLTNVPKFEKKTTTEEASDDRYFVPPNAKQREEEYERKVTEAKKKRDSQSFDDYMMSTFTSAKDGGEGDVNVIYAIFYVCLFRAPHLVSLWLHDHTFIHYYVSIPFLFVLYIALFYMLTYNFFYGILLGKKKIDFFDALKFAFAMLFIVFIALQWAARKKD